MTSLQHKVLVVDLSEICVTSIGGRLILNISPGQSRTVEGRFDAPGLNDHLSMSQSLLALLLFNDA